MRPRRVLLFYPPNNRSVAIETLCKAIREGGHELIVLTLSATGPLHGSLEKNGIKTFTYPPSKNRGWKYFRFFKQSRYLARFCRENKIDAVWSHLQEANIISIMAQPFLKPKLVVFRHHAESAFYAEFGEKMGMKRSRGEAFLDKIINKYAKLIVVPSSGVWYGMEKYEKCKMSKVRLISYIYDFTTYQQPDAEKVKALRNQYPCELLLIMISRLIPSKQHKPVFQVIKKLADEGLSIKMIVMDEGPLRPELEGFIQKNDLLQHVFMVGFKEDFVNYMSAADLLIHPSLTEASNNVVKEMGLLQKGVAVCRNVGDFNDYITEGKNGYFLDMDDLSQAIESVIRDAYARPDRIKNFGVELRKDVFTHFSDSAENRQRFLSLLD